MIKKYKLSFLLCALLFGSCSEFLEPKMPSIVTDEFYNTKSGQEKLLTDIYARFRQVFNTGELQYFGTDLYMAITASPVERMFNGYDNTFNSTAPIVADYWSNLYKIVQESNILLNRTTEATAGNDFTSITAQGRFLRVLAYYYLVETFGPVPLLTDENTGTIQEVTRTAESEIYSFLIEELTAIKGALPATTTQAGRLTNPAVVHLLGKLHLTRAYRNYSQSDDFTKAAQLLDEVISNPSRSLLPSYAAVYDENNQNNAEVIWAIQYGTDRNYIGSGNSQQQIFGYNIVALDPDMFVQKQSDYSSMSRYYWVIPRVHELFTNPDTDTRYDVTFKRTLTVNNPSHASFGKPGIYFPRWNDASGNSVGAVKYYAFKTGENYTWNPQSTALAVLNNASDRMPILHKFQDTKIDWGTPGSREDVVIRLSDTYLLSAEAHLGAGNTTAALERLNTIRKRAASSEDIFEKSMRLTTVNIHTIMDERARELLGDHDRWFDLKRSGTLLERAKAYNPFVSTYNNLNAKHLVRPIPQDEMNKVKGLTQNDGY